MNNEICKNCIHLGTIYIPPTKERVAMHLKGCFAFEKRAMYLDDIQGYCEIFAPQKKRENSE